jgi:hypothetical protein
LFPELAQAVSDFTNLDKGHANVVLAIGRSVRGNLDQERNLVFGKPRFVEEARVALDFFEFQLRACRAAVDAWTIVAKRNRVVKDIRKMIGTMIWEARENALFERK